MERHWNLDVLYTSFEDERFLNDMKDYAAFVKDANEWAETQLKDTSGAREKIETYVERGKEAERFSSLWSYAHLSVSTNALNEAAIKASDKLREISVGMTRPQALFVKFIARLENLDAIIEGSQTLKEYAFILREMKNRSGHEMS